MADDLPSPQILLSTAAFFARPAREAFRHAAEAGFEGVEVMVTRDPATQEAHLLAGLSAEFGLPVRAIHAPFLLISRRAFGADPVGKIYRTVHLAEEVGSPLVVAHPPYRWQAPYRRWLEESMPAFSDRTGVAIAIENMFPIRLPGDRGVRVHAQRSLEDLARFEHVVLDTSHAAVAGLDPLEAVDQLGRRLAHVHLSNNAGRGWDSHLPVDEGTLDLAGFLTALRAGGFGGAVSLELDIRRHLGDDDTIRQVLVRCKEFCESSLLQPA